MADASTSTGDVTMVRANSRHLPWFPGPGCKAQGVLEPSRASLRFTKTPLDWMEKRRTNRYAVGEPGGLRGTLPIASAPFLPRQGLSCLSPGRGWGAGERSASRAGRSGLEGQGNESPGPSSLLPANPISRSPWCTLQAPALSSGAHLAVSHGPGDVSPEPRTGQGIVMCVPSQGSGCVCVVL